MPIEERDYMRRPDNIIEFKPCKLILPGVRPMNLRRAKAVVFGAVAAMALLVAGIATRPAVARWRAVGAIERASASVTLAVKQGAPEAALRAAAARGVRVTVATGDRGANRALAAAGVTAYTLPKRDLPALPRVAVDGEDEELLALARRGQRATPAR